jgi:hypothetical protein
LKRDSHPVHFPFGFIEKGFYSSYTPFLLPESDPGFLSITFLGELVFMLWLLIRGWKIQIGTDRLLAKIGDWFRDLVN